MFCVGVWTVKMAGSKSGPTEEHPTLRHLSDTVFPGGNIHRVLQQHSHHHTVPAHSGLYGECTVAALSKM